MREPEAEIQALLWKLCPLYQHVGMTVESARGGHYRCRLPLTPANVNHLQTVHAALQWALAEVLGGVALLDTFEPAHFSKLYAAVASARVEFVRPARGDIVAEASLAPDEQLRLRARIAAGQEARFELQPEVRLVDGETVARLQAEYVVRPRRAG